MGGKQSDRTEMQAAKQLANESLRAAAVAEWQARREFMRQSRGGDLTLPDNSAPLASYESMTQAVHARALAKLEDTALHDPDPRWSNQACELILNYDIARRRIQADLDAKHSIVEHRPQPAQLTSGEIDGVPREEKVRILRLLEGNG